jgi:hypothetical protein
MRLKVFIAAAVLALAAAVPALASTGKGSLFHNGDVVGTVVVPAHVDPGSGNDPFYAVTNGASGQLGIAGVAPGDGSYHGGNWAFNAVTFRPGVTPYLLTSDEAVFAAASRGDVTVTRVPDNDFRCPVT